MEKDNDDPGIGCARLANFMHAEVVNARSQNYDGPASIVYFDIDGGPEPIAFSFNETGRLAVNSMRCLLQMLVMMPDVSEEDNSRRDDLIQNIKGFLEENFADSQ